MKRWYFVVALWLLAGPQLFAYPEPQIDVPQSQRIRNTGGMGPGGPGTGAGLCVFTSLEHGGRWQNEKSMVGFQRKMTHEPGGGYPSKVDVMMERYCPGVKYLQYTGPDPSLIELALKTGRIVSGTWGPAHMVNFVHLDSEYGAILDNNRPEVISWYPREQFLRNWRAGGGAGWVVVLLNPGPPPPPRNAPRVPLPAPLPAPKPACPNCPAEGWAPNDDGTYFFYANGVKAGRYDPITHEWDVMEAGAWIRRPAPFARKDNGLAWRWDGRERAWVRGGGVQGVELTAAGAGSLLDDSNHDHITFIGSPIPAGITGPYRLQSYQPDDWALDCGFVKEGAYGQAPDGQVLLRTKTAEEFVGQLRRPDPNYQPDADPVPKPPKPPVDPKAPLPQPQQPEVGGFSTTALVGSSVLTFLLPILGQLLIYLGGRGKIPAPPPGTVPVMPVPVTPVPAAAMPLLQSVARILQRRMEHQEDKETRGIFAELAAQEKAA